MIQRSGLARRLGVAVCLALPLLLLAGLTARAEWTRRVGELIRVHIAGYDPRDVLRGHFLRYRIAWNWEGGVPDLSPGVICVRGLGDDPPVRPLASDVCAIRLVAGPTGGGRMFMPSGVSGELFVPEAQADAIAQLLSNHSADVTVDLRLHADGTAQVSDWHIDGRTVAEWTRR